MLWSRVDRKELTELVGERTRRVRMQEEVLAFQRKVRWRGCQMAGRLEDESWDAKSWSGMEVGCGTMGAALESTSSVGEDRGRRRPNKTHGHTS